MPAPLVETELPRALLGPGESTCRVPPPTGHSNLKIVTSPAGRWSASLSDHCVLSDTAHCAARGLLPALTERNRSLIKDLGYFYYLKLRDPVRASANENAFRAANPLDTPTSSAGRSDAQFPHANQLFINSLTHICESFILVTLRSQMVMDQPA